MLKLSWHIGDVVRKLRLVYDLNQRDIFDRPNTASSLERGGNFEHATVTRVAELLSSALQEKGIIDAPLTVEDLNGLVPVPRNEALRSSNPPLEPDAVDVALMFQRLSVGAKATARTVMQALSQTDPHAGGLPNAGGPTGTTQR